MNTRTSDVVFVFPPAYGNLGAFRNHLGVAYLRAALAHERIATTQYLNRHPGTVDQVASDLLAHRPGVVGFTVYDSNFALCLAIARAVKRKRPGVRVVLGGPTPSFNAPQILRNHPDIDACVVGETEETGCRIFTALLREGNLEDLPPGLAVRRHDEVVGASLPPLVGDAGPTLAPSHSTLDVVPSPYLAGALDDGRAGVLTGRGCTHHCQYCCFAALGRKKLRLHSIERVVDELARIAELQRRHGERYVVPIHDDAFTLLPARAKSLCQAIVDRRLGLLLSCITRADALDDELLRLMREAGFVSVAFGLESAVPSVLREVGKVRPPGWPHLDLEPEREFLERVRSSVTAAKAYGFSVGVSIILGLPTETLENAKATLRFVKDLPVDFYMHNFLWVYPGTPLWETHDRYGITCGIDSMGLAVTSDYAYDVEQVRPLRGCSLEQDARVVRALAIDAFQGCGVSGTPRGGTSVAVLHAGSLTRETAAWLARVLDVGSVLVHVYPALTRANEVRQLYADRRAFGDCLVPARHYVQALGRARRGGTARWSLACPGVDFYATHAPALVSIAASDGPAPLLDWLEGTRTDCALCEVADCLRQPDALVAFLRGRRMTRVPDEWDPALAGLYNPPEAGSHATADEEVGNRLRHMPAPPALRYPARWLAGSAPCLSLSRIEIDAEGRVRCCRHGRPIGQVGDERRVLQRRLEELAAEAERRRGCDDCARADCPRCPFPGMDDEAYCRVMRQREHVLRLVKWVHAYSRVPGLLSTESDRVSGD